MLDQSSAVTFLFSDIEGSTRLWEHHPQAMQEALARHDAISRAAVRSHRGRVVKMTGDGLHAVFASAADALAATLELQQALLDPSVTNGITLRVRCGLHSGIDSRRDGDFFGREVNRAARIMKAAHGGQMLLSQAVAERLRGALPDGVDLRDLGRVRLRDLGSAQHLFQVTHPRLRVDFPALRSLEATPNNLAQQLNSFIDREQAVAELKQLLATSRLVTLVGTGGIGKTRLSVQLAADVLDNFPDGVWFVDLAPLSDARLVPQALASVLGVREEPGHSLADALHEYMRERQLLVLLDNCEHLVDACAELALQLLQLGPRVSLLASSRELLRVSGEVVYPVPALSVPGPAARQALDQLTRHHAVQLFIDRALASQPSFRLDQRSAAAVADICARLDGMPLAIELAAARTRALTVETIAARLDDRFRVLGGADRTRRARQQTLRALIDWSHDLLSIPERVLFRRLSIFAGSFTLEAAEAVGEGGGIESGDVIELLIQLVEKSLVVIDAERARYRLLDTVRAYAKERLDESGEAAAVRSGHLHHYLDLAEQAASALGGPEQGAWLARLDLERENLLAAHAAVDLVDGGSNAGLRLVYALRQYWLNRGALSLGYRITLEALARVGAGLSDAARCRALFGAGQICCFMGRYAAGREHLEQSLRIAREIGDRALVARVLQPLGMASAGEGDLPGACARMEDAVAMARELGNRRQLAAALNGLAQVHRSAGRLDLAEPLYEQVLALARELGDQESIAIGLLNLAMANIGRNAPERCPELLLEVLAIAQATGSKPALQCTLDVGAGLAAAMADWPRALRYFGCAQAWTRTTGLRRDPADEAFLAPLVARAREALGPQAAAAAEAGGDTLEEAAVLPELRCWLGGEPGRSSRES